MLYIFLLCKKANLLHIEFTISYNFSSHDILSIKIYESKLLLYLIYCPSIPTRTYNKFVTKSFYVTFKELLLDSKDGSLSSSKDIFFTV